MLKYNHGLDVKEASVNSQDITIKVVCLTCPTQEWEARVQGVYRACAIYQAVTVPAKLEPRPHAVHACCRRTRALLCSPLMHPITVPHICIPVCCVSCVA